MDAALLDRGVGYRQIANHLVDNLAGGVVLDEGPELALLFRSCASSAGERAVIG